MITNQTLDFPQKKRELHNHHFDSTIWNEFKFRDDDIIISTYAKSGTTWVQQIISQLLFEGKEDLNVAEMSPWLDLRVPEKHIKLSALESQKHRRFIKTHLPVDALVFSPKAKYIYIGRDGRDVVWSMYNHHFNANQDWYNALNNTPGLVGDPIGPPDKSIVQYFEKWLHQNGHPFWPFWENIASWWSIRDLPNVQLLHFESLKKDMPKNIKMIAEFLEIEINDSKWSSILEHCSFEYMKENAVKSVPLGGAFWDGGAKTFIHKGVNGRWRDILEQNLSSEYEKIAAKELGEECSEWLATGVVL